MSLQVRDPRSRGRSKSPGGRDRSRSRDGRVPSPPKEKSKKSSKKYYDSDSADEHTKHKKSLKISYESDSDDDRHKEKSRKSKKYSDSDSDDRRDREKKSSKKYDDSDSDDRHKHKDRHEKKSSRKEHDSDSSDPDRRREKSKKTSKKYYEPDSSDSREHRHGHGHSSHAPEPPRSDKHVREPGSHPSYAQPDRYNYAQPNQYAAGQPTDYHGTRHMSYPKTKPDEWADIPEYERPGYVPPEGYPYQPGGPTSPRQQQDRQLSLNTTGSLNINAGPTSPRPQYASPTQQPYGQVPGAFPYGPHTDVPDHHRVHSISSPSGHQYASPTRYEYAQMDPNIKYKSKTDKHYTQTHEQQYVKPYSQTADPQFVEIKPGGKHGRTSVSDGLAPRMHSLSVSGSTALTVATHGLGHGDGGRPPASPLLEAYRGTYQSMSPMPSPMMLPSKMDEGLDELSPIDSDSDSRHGKSSKHGKKTRHDSHSTVVISPTMPSGRKRVSFYDPAPDAKALALALNHHTRVDSKPIITILPHLSTDDILELRTEYKNEAKVGGKGINIAKHIKMKVPGNLGKAAYATALGRWESEAYWANSYYQAGTSRRELLIESLMGRTNGDIREIKNSFNDKKYADSLEKCMKAELKADKFRVAILLALEEKRMSDSALLSLELVKRDVLDLHRALTAPSGGETAMIEIIVVRSDAHLREVLRVYEQGYRKNFAREMIGKSRNLVVSPSIPAQIRRRRSTLHILTSWSSGRNTSPHPQRRLEPTHARRTPPTPSNCRIRHRQRPG